MCLPGTSEAVRERFEREGPPTVRESRSSRRHALATGAAAMLAALVPAGAAAASSRHRERLADLTHVFSEEFPLFLGTPVQNTRETAVSIPVNGFYAQKWTFGSTQRRTWTSAPTSSRAVACRRTSRLKS